MNLTQALIEVVDRPKLTGESYLPHGHKVAGYTLVPKAGGQGDDGSQVYGGLVQLQAAHHIDIGITGVDKQSSPLFQYGQQQHGAVEIHSRDHPPGVVGHGGSQ